MDEIRARKARERSKKFGVTFAGEEALRVDEEEGGLFGIKETRIGAVGTARSGEQDQTVKDTSIEASAQLY